MGRKLKEAQEDFSSAKVKILIAEKAALRKDVMVMAADMRKESKVHNDEAERHRSLVKELEKEKRHLEARLETAQLSLVLERKRTVVDQLVGHSSEKNLGMDQDPLSKITQEGQMASGEQR